jgi:hypothetical protein
MKDALICIETIEINLDTRVCPVKKVFSFLLYVNKR